ncbi:hypothetical protein ACFLWY_00080 [Chloroflexota bacterium]
MQTQKKREWGLALVFLGAGVVAQYVLPQYGVPIALVIIVIGFILINNANREASTLYSDLPPIGQDSTAPLPDYSEEWSHFDKINDAIVKLQSASLGQAKELSSVIQHERMYLDDSQLQSILDKLVFEVDQWARLGVTPEGLSPLIPMIISSLINRMHRRYRRS